MTNTGKIVLAAKCAPRIEILSSINKANIEAVELFLSEKEIKDINSVINLCKQFPLRYALHAPDDIFEAEILADLAQSINAEVVVFHNIYWEEEWSEIASTFRKIKAKPCIENTFSVHEPLKFIRKYGFGRCLDLEHLEMECMGIYEEAFVKIMGTASHIHMTGYMFGTELWHTHIHQSPEHSIRFLNMLERSGFSGFVVSEATMSLQTYGDFQKLSDFFSNWVKSILV